MARKKKSKTQPFIIKFIGITLLVVGIGFGVTKGAIYLFRNSEYFRIRSVTIDHSLQFIKTRDLSNLIGNNIIYIE